jgi:hypothetical protein
MLHFNVSELQEPWTSNWSYRTDAAEPLELIDASADEALVH